MSLVLQYLTTLGTLTLNQTLSKTLSTSRGFGLNVDLSGVESRGVTDYKDRPLQPGEKVGRYRFMSYYLEGKTDHFDHFFASVVDPEWLEGNSEEARALRQVNRHKPSKPWPDSVPISEHSSCARSSSGASKRRSSSCCRTTRGSKKRISAPSRSSIRSCSS